MVQFGPFWLPSVLEIGALRPIWFHVFVKLHTLGDRALQIHIRSAYIDIPIWLAYLWPLSVQGRMRSRVPKTLRDDHLGSFDRLFLGRPDSMM